MSLRSPAKHENGRISLDMALLSNCHSRACGNPGLLRRTNLDCRRPSFPIAALRRYFRRSTRRTRSSGKAFVPFVV